MTLPAELLRLILAYDGRIRYRRGVYVNVIHPDDARYDLLRPYLVRKAEILRQVQFEGRHFYLVIGFQGVPHRGLCYASGGWTARDHDHDHAEQVEICYYNFADGVQQIRTYLP